VENRRGFGAGFSGQPPRGAARGPMKRSVRAPLTRSAGPGEASRAIFRMTPWGGWICFDNHGFSDCAGVASSIFLTASAAALRMYHSYDSQLCGSCFKEGSAAHAAGPSLPKPSTASRSP